MDRMSSTTAGGGNDTLRFEGITFSQVASGLLKSGNDLVLNVSGGSDRVTLKNWFLGGDNVVDTITFVSGGQQLTRGADLQRLWPQQSGPERLGLPTCTCRTIVLSARFSRVRRAIRSCSAHPMPDLIDGGAGNDTLRGNLGNDYLLGGDGNDTYQFAAGDGQDVINNLSNAPACRHRRIEHRRHRAREPLVLTTQATISSSTSWGGSTDAITIQDWYANAGQRLDSIQAGSSTLLAECGRQPRQRDGGLRGSCPAERSQLTPAQRAEVNAVIAASWQGGGQGAMNASIDGRSRDAGLLFRKSGNDPAPGTDEPLTFADWYASTNEELDFDGPATAFEAARAAMHGPDELGARRFAREPLSGAAATRQRSVAISRIVTAATEHWRTLRSPPPASWVTLASVALRRRYGLSRACRARRRG